MWKRYVRNIAPPAPIRRHCIGVAVNGPDVRDVELGDSISKSIPHIAGHDVFPWEISAAKVVELDAVGHNGMIRRNFEVTFAVHIRRI